MRRRDELAAYRRAGVPMFSLPGEAKVAVLVELVSVNLAEICTAASSRSAKLWCLTPEELQEPKELTPPTRARRRDGDDHGKQNTTHL